MELSVEHPPPPCYDQARNFYSKSFIVSHLRHSMSDEKFEVIIVGAGLSGVAAALTLARNGVEVLVIERGDFPGAKNLFGGILYSGVLAELVPKFWEKAPIERHIVNRRWVALDVDSQVAIDLKSAHFDKPPYNNTFTALRSQFDRWFAEQAEEEGALIICETTVEGLLTEGDRVVGVRTGRDDGDVFADCVILAEGANALLSEGAGLRPAMTPANRVNAVKEVLALPSEIIEDRFHLEGSQGAAVEYFGGAVKGMVGSAFIYTNRDSISVGVGCLIEDYLGTKTAPYELLDEFKAHPSVAPLLRGAKTVEYATKMIPEDSYDDFSDLYADGIMLVGDCAGLVNPSIHHEGTNLAMASGVFAAEAFLEARKKRDFSRTGLGSYRSRLNASWVMQDLKHYRGTVDFLRANREFIDSYPRITVELMRDYFTIDDTPKTEVRRRLIRKVRDEVSFLRLMRQLWQARKNLI
ncbi:MAG: FAD-dependent oxidoreductase [Acidobacteria bacterium]|nr:FAD-dependent oxidoreductase [Acidobacteriota bacterium]